MAYLAFINRLSKLRHLFQRCQLKSPLAIALIVFSTGLLSTLSLVLIDYRLTLDQEELLATENLYRVRASLEKAFYKRLTLVVSLKAFVESHQNLDWRVPANQKFIQEHFEAFTISLNQQVPGIIRMELAPAGIVENITNLERNRQFIGYDIFSNHNRRPNVLNSLRKRDVFVEGPVALIHSGDAIIARRPIFIEADTSSPQQYIAQNRAQPEDDWLQEIPSDFWGFATVVIDQKKLYQEAGLTDSQGRYQYAIRGRDGLGEQGEVFWGEASVFDDPFTTATISLPNGEWIIGGQLVSGISEWRSVWIIFLGVSVSGMLGYSTFSSKKTDEKHQRNNQELIRATQLKDEFLANMSHEFRTPLNAILGTTEGLQDTVFGPVTCLQSRQLETIERSGYHLLSLINDVLDVAKIEAGQMTLVLSSTRLNSLLTSCLVMIQSQAHKKNIQIEINQSHDLPNLLLDERRIRQALVNLLNNAVKFTPKGGKITLNISIFKPPLQASSAWLPLQCHLKISVTDTGIGIASQDQKKLFQPFIQIDSTLNRQYDGTGLGLALVKHIVELHGGEVTVNSELGLGSCFTIDIPCSIDPPMIKSELA